MSSLICARSAAATGQATLGASSGDRTWSRTCISCIFWRGDNSPARSRSRGRVAPHGGRDGQGHRGRGPERALRRRGARRRAQDRRGPPPPRGGEAEALRRAIRFLTPWRAARPGRLRPGPRRPFHSFSAAKLTPPLSPSLRFDRHCAASPAAPIRPCSPTSAWAERKYVLCLFPSGSQATPKTGERGRKDMRTLRRYGSSRMRASSRTIAWRRPWRPSGVAPARPPGNSAASPWKGSKPDWN